MSDYELIDCPFQVNGCSGCLLGRDQTSCDDAWKKGLKAASALDGEINESNDLEK